LPSETGQVVKITYLESIERSGQVVEKIVDSDWLYYYKKKRENVGENKISIGEAIAKLKGDKWKLIKMSDEKISEIYTARSKAFHEDRGSLIGARNNLTKAIDFIEDWLEHRRS